MATKNIEILQELIELSHVLGSPNHKLAIIGEGNTSARIDRSTFYVKASGTQLSTISKDGFVQVEFSGIMQLIEMTDVEESSIKQVFEESKVDKSQKLRPSVETLLHAICLSFDGVNFVGHTHPVSINMLACSSSYPENLKGRLYPDEVVLLGRESVFVPYMDPGVLLAQKVKQECDLFISKYGDIPKIIYMQNHGMVALGSTALEVQNITLTANKAAEIRLGALSAGDIHLLSRDVIDHIAGRPDELYRKKQFAAKGK